MAVLAANQSSVVFTLALAGCCCVWALMSFSVNAMLWTGSMYYKINCQLSFFYWLVKPLKVINVCNVWNTIFSGLFARSYTEAVCANVGSCVQVHSLQSHNGTISPPLLSTFYCELSLISLSVVIRRLCRGESWQTQDPFQNSIKFCILQDAPERASNVQTN